MSAPAPAPTNIGGHFATANDKSPVVEVLTWFTFAVGVLSVFARIGTKLQQTGKVNLGDYLTLGSLVCALAQSIAITKAANYGLGQHLKSLSDDHTTSFLKAGYAADIFFVVGHGLAKLSFMETGIPIVSRQSGKILRIFEAIALAWAVSALLVVLFQCGVPSPWDYLTQTCINRTGFWIYYSIANLLTDLASLGLLFESFMHIQVPWTKKCLIMGVFGSRFLTTPAIITQLVYTGNGSLTSDDPTFDTWPLQVSISVVQCIGIMTACIPILKPFIDSLDSGHLGGDDLRRRGKTSNGYSSEQGASANGRSANKANGIKQSLASAAPSHRSGFREIKEHGMSDFEKSKVSANSYTVTTAHHDTNGSWDGQSRMSQKGLIQMTRTWDVEVDGGAAAQNSAPAKAGVAR